MESLKIVISGASGFIGANLTKKLSKDNDIYALTRGTNWRLNDIHSSFTYIALDLALDSREKILKIIKKIRPDVLIHCASYDYHIDTQVREMLQTNIIGALNLFDACNDAIIINTGSSSEYGIKDTPMKENDSMAPATNYAMSKALMTTFFTSRNAITLRPFSVYGYYESMQRLVPYLLYSSIKGKKATLKNPASVRDFIFIDDMVKAYILAIKNYHRVENRIFNIGSGKQSSVFEVARLVGVGLDADTKMGSSEPVMMWQADINRAKKELGWHPTHTLNEGIVKTKKWMLDNIELYDKQNGNVYGRVEKNSK